MAIDFTPTMSKRFFVGRQMETDIFISIVTDQRPEWIIHIPGDGGVGKTRLLEHFREYAQKQSNMLITAELIDFYKTANQTSFSLLQEITRQLGIEHFPQFSRARKEFQNILNMEPEPSERQEGARRVIEAFLSDYAELLQQGFRVLFLFDTCEEMHATETWVLDTLLNGINNIEKEAAKKISEEDDTEYNYQTTFVLAGRKRLTFMPEFEEQIAVFELPTLTLEETQDFFQQGKTDPALASSSEILQLYKRTGGRPLYVALTYDWLRNEIGTATELLDLNETFGEKLVSWVRRLDSNEKYAILYMALAWRRMESGLLARLLKIDKEKAEETIDGLSRFSFVKFRPPSKNLPSTLHLHDEMRLLINNHVWPQEGKSTQEVSLPQIIDWYSGRIGDRQLLKGESLPENDEKRALLAEWLFYQFKVDPDTAMDAHERLFRSASHYLDLAFCDLLNQEVERFITKLSPQKKDDLRFREALINFRRENFKGASQIWYSLLRRPDLKGNLRATILMLLVELESYMGRPDKALEHAKEGEELYAKLIKAAGNLQEKGALETELGQLHNNRGYAHRVNMNLQEALDCYNQALKYKSQAKAKNVARTLNNMGYTYFLLGDLIQARTHVGRSLQLRRELEIPYELALGYNTMGIIFEQSGRMNEAIDLYDKALGQSRIARSERAEALVLLNLGRIKRLTNEYNDSLEYLEKAQQVFDKLHDTDYLIQTLNELGCTYRQSVEKGDLSKALTSLKKSLALSKEIRQTFFQADNWEDIAIVHRLQAVDAHIQNNKEEYKKYANLVRDAVKHVKELAQQHGYVYLMGKSSRTLGDLAYLEGAYDIAFDHYFEAGWSMVQAWIEGKHSPLLIQRRYEEMVDRMQEQLQALPNSKDTLHYSNKLLARFNELSSEEQEKMKITKEFLEAAVQMAELLG